MNSPSRRSVLTAAAWTAPAVAIAAAAPAFATSTESTPALVCELIGTRTNHGHKDTPKPRPGTHHYHVSVACTSTVRAVWIAGHEATHSAGVWTVHHLRGGVWQPVRVLTDAGIQRDREVRFQPEAGGAA